MTNKYKYFIGNWKMFGDFSSFRIIKSVNVYIKKLSDTNFRVFLGPYIDLNSLKNSFNAIIVLQFDNIEIIKK